MSFAQSFASGVLSPADALLALAALAVGAIYVRGARRVWATDAAYWPLRQKRGRLPLWRVGLFLTGLSAITVALSSLAHAAAAQMLALHTMQHHLLVTLGTPLCVLGEPALAFGALLAPRQRARLASLGRRVAATRTFRWTLGRPLAVWLAHVLLAWSGYLPGVHTALYYQPLLHALHHVLLIASAVAFWWLLIGPAVTWLPSARGPRSVATLAAWVQNNLLSALIAFSSLAAFPEYAARPPLWDLSRVDAQRVAGAVQYLPAEVVYLFALSLLVFGWLMDLDRQATQPPAPERAGTPRLPDRTRAGLLTRRERMLREEWRE